MSKFKKILFESSYACKQKGCVLPAADRPDCQLDGGKLLYEYVIKNKFKKIIDFGTWLGGSVLCEAQGLQELAERYKLKGGNDPFLNGIDYLVSDAQAALDRNESWVLHRGDDLPEFMGEIHVYDKYWDNEGQNGHIGNVLKYLQEYGCYKNVQFKFKKIDIFDWLHQSESFDFIHVDIHNRLETMVGIVKALTKQIDDGGVIIFNGGALRYGYAPFGSKINNDGIDVSHTMVSLIEPENYDRLKESGLDFEILTQEWPGFICVDRRNKMPWPAYMRNARDFWKK